MSEINLNVKLGIREWSQPILEVVGESIQRRVGCVLDEKNAIEMINEIAEVIVKHATFVEGPVYINPYQHDITIPSDPVNVSTSSIETVIGIGQAISSSKDCGHVTGACSAQLDINKSVKNEMEQLKALRDDKE